ncbi:type II toxin-antitoxin system YafO family toxin [Halomonas kashgarensis]|uniref:type II toxin-antitoxin system YafO family toxin n=1 Tax=Halomonas kashgarensis TaxID=3084920 RepID=UPI003A957A69
MFHSETEHYFDSIDATFPGFKLLESFTDYIASGRDVVPDCFGNDAPYTQPYGAFRAGLMHIHIAVPPTTFPKKRPQADRKCPMNAPDQDAALVRFGVCARRARRVPLLLACHSLPGRPSASKR